MQKLRSKVNDREFYIDATFSGTVEGIPCFSEKEIQDMKGRTYTRGELDVIFDTKLELGATVEPLSVMEDLGYAKPRSREELAKDYSAKIVAMLREKGAKLREEKACAEEEIAL